MTPMRTDFSPLRGKKMQVEGGYQPTLRVQGQALPHVDPVSHHLTTRILFTRTCSFTNTPWGHSTRVSRRSLKGEEACPPSTGRQGRLCNEGLVEGTWPPHCPHPTGPAFWHQAKRINTLKATVGIIKMTNWRIETIYAFVYLKILPLFTETRKMGIVQHRGAWAGRAGLQPACSALLGKGGLLDKQARPGRLSVCFLLNFASHLSADRLEHVTGLKQPQPA